jgi:hypothetical protein
MAVNFDDYLNVPMADMKRVSLPEGHYYGRVKDYGTKESQGGKPMLNIQFTLDSCGDDVDQSQLPEKGVSGKMVSNNYMLDEDFGRAGIREVIVAAGVAFDEAQGFGTYLPSIKGQPVMLHIKQRPVDKQNPDGDKTEDIKKVLPPA